MQNVVQDKPIERQKISPAETRPIQGNLPTPLSAFIGRGREVTEVKHLLSTHRLVTCTGAGGSGKTRLSIRVASELEEEFADGVWFVGLASIFDAALVPQSIASIFKIRDQAGQSLIEVITSYLSVRDLLLVLDNCEHLISACAQFAASVLENCPGLKILATSREPLGVAGEAVWIVPPLSLPSERLWPRPTRAPDALRLYEESESVQLFVARAAETSPGFKLTTGNGAQIAGICRHLDGMPLAIELAAARVRSLSIHQIAQRLQDRFHLLTRGSRTAPPRHQTLAATLDWSYALLSIKEQQVLQRFAVFAGGATLDAAESVCTGDGVESAEVMDALAHLVDKSMVTADKLESGETRYRLVETIRQYAFEKLGESGEVVECKNRHLNYFIQQAESAGPHLGRIEQLSWLNWFEAEHDNIRAALEWSQLAERGEAGLQLAAVTAIFWKLHGYHREGRKRLSIALDQKTAQAPTLARAHVLLQACILTFYQSDYPAARTFAEASLAIFREHGPAGLAGAADALEMLAEVSTETGDYSTATKLYREGLAASKEAGYLRGIGENLKMLGWLEMRTGTYEKAESMLKEALDVCRQSGELHQIISALAGLGELAIRQGWYSQADTYLQESLHQTRGLGEKWGLGIVLGSLGWLALRQSDFKQARDFLAESLAVRMETFDQGGIAWCLEKLAEANSLQTHWQPAAIIFGAASALRARSGAMMDAADRPDYGRLISKIETMLGERAFASAWAEGEQMPLEMVVDYALHEVEPANAESARVEKEKFAGLTARERQVAALVAQGKSNREIAQAMTVGVKTIETYVTRILNKLGYDSRVQIATWAVEKGLS